LSKRQKPDAATVERLAYGIDEAAAVIGIGRSALYDLIRDKRLVARKIGARTIITKNELTEFLGRLPSTAA
jgi:excisionase family DNA binding protein